MHKIFKVLLLIVLLFIFGVSAYYIYPRYMALQTEKTRVILMTKVSELDKLLLNGHDCQKVTAEAKTFLKTYDRAEQVWSLLGVCQFDTGDTASARASFEKVLSINPTNLAAKSYIYKITSYPEAVKIMASGNSVTAEQFEKFMGVKFPLLTFKTAEKKASNIPEYLSATYTSSKSFTETVLYVKEILDASGLEFSTSSLKEGTIFAVTSSAQQKIFSILKGSLVTVKADYLRLQ